jgi:hypothetical protein
MPQNLEKYHLTKELYKGGKIYGSKTIFHLGSKIMKKIGSKSFEP